PKLPGGLACEAEERNLPHRAERAENQPDQHVEKAGAEIAQEGPFTEMQKRLENAAIEPRRIQACAGHAGGQQGNERDQTDAGYDELDDSERDNAIARGENEDG